MDDLISRKRIMDEAKRLSGPMTGDGWDNWGVYALIERQPSVPAVPLDKLCDWLAEKWDCPPERMTEEGLCKKFNWKCSKCCRQSIEKWMEGLDGGEGLIP